MPTLNYDPDTTGYFFESSSNVGVSQYGIFTDSATNNGVVVVNASFSLSAQNNSHVYGDAIFNDTSKNDGIVHGNAYVATGATVPASSVIGAIIPF
jgi:hypothetical protein